MDLNGTNRLTNQEYIPSLSSFHIFHKFLNNKVKVHWHEFYEISFIVSGNGKHILNGNEYLLHPGTCFLLTPIDIHEIIPGSNQPFEIYNVVFTDECLQDGLYEIIFNTRTFEPVNYAAEFDQPLDNELKHEFERMLLENNKRLPGYQMIMKGALERILIEFVRARKPRNGNTNNISLPKQYHDIFRAVTYLHHHFRENITLGEMARHAQLAPNYFSQCFHEVMGKTFQIYLQDIRLDFAKTLLKQSDLSVTDICLASGFKTLSHFNRTFKQKVHKSPREYRNTGGDTCEAL